MTQTDRNRLCKKCENCNNEYLKKSGEGCPNWHNDNKYGGCSEFYPKTEKEYCIICEAIKSGANIKWDNPDFNEEELYFCPKCGKRIRG